jgi:ankyrin repeat protein
MSRKLKRHNTSPELAFDACDYFTDDLSNFSVELGKDVSLLKKKANNNDNEKQFLDAREKARLDIHAALRDACCQGDVNSVSSLLSSLSKDAELIVNMAPSGASTLLFTACQTGCKDIVRVLLEHGADGRYHPVTKYSPLYIACHYGHRDIVEMLLLRFPELIQVQLVPSRPTTTIFAMTNVYKYIIQRKQKDHISFYQLAKIELLILLV